MEEKFTLNKRSYVIRECEDRDYYFVYNLLKCNMIGFFTRHWGGWNPQVFRDNFKKENIKIVMYNNRRIGFTDLEYKNHFSYINNIQISTNYRSKGLGSYLLSLLEDTTINKGKQKIRLQVFKDSIARKLYEKHSYKVIDDKGSSIIMEKTLK